MTTVLLEPKREKFAQEMAVHGIAARAARAAEVCPNTATQWCRNIDMQLRIEELKIEIREGYLTTRDQVIANLARIAYADHRKLFNGVNLKRIDQLDDATSEAIDSFEITEGYDKDGAPISGLKIKTITKRDRLKAMQELGKHFNIYADHEKSGAGTMIVNIDGKDAKL